MRRLQFVCLCVEQLKELCTNFVENFPHESPYLDMEDSGDLRESLNDYVWSFSST